METHPYLDPKRFPLTTQKGLDMRQQKMLDAVNRDDLREMLEQRRPLWEEQRRVWAELEEKAKLL